MPSKEEYDARAGRLSDGDPDAIRRRLAYLESRFEDLSARVAHDDTKFAAMEARIHRLEIVVAVIATH